MARRASREHRPSVQGLESRAVPTVISPLAFGGAGLATNPRHPGTVHVAGTGIGGSGNGGGTGAITVGGGVGRLDQIPTPRELALERFSARFTRVQVGVGAPNSADQARQILYAGSGIGYPLLQSRLVMRLFTPVDPAGTITGIAQVRDRTVGTSGTAVVLNLTGSTADLDARGRPTRLRWTVDANLSGGAFLNGLAVNPDGSALNRDGTPASGTLTIAYAPNPLHPPHGTGINGGLATAVFDGHIRTTNSVTDLTRFELGHF